MRRGEIWIVDLPHSGGREQSGRRPTAIVHKDDGGNVPIVAIVPFTSRLEAARFDYTVRIEPTPENGLTSSSVALVFQTTSVDRVRLRARLGILSPEDMARIDAAIRTRFGV